MPDHAESPQPTVLPFPAAPPLALAPPPAAPARRGFRGLFRRRHTAEPYPMPTARAAAAAPAAELALARTVPARPPAPWSEPEAVATPAPRGYVRNPAAPDVTDAAERTGVWSSRNAAAAATKGLEAQNAWAKARESLQSLIPEEHAATRVLTSLREREAELRAEAEQLLAGADDAAPDESKARLRSQARSFLTAAQAAQREAVPVERKRNELTVRIDGTPQRVYDETQIIIRYFWLEVETDAMAAAEEEGVYRTTEDQGNFAQLDFEEQFRRMHIPLPAEIEAMIADMRRTCAGPSEDVA